MGFIDKRFIFNRRNKEPLTVLKILDQQINSVGMAITRVTEDMQIGFSSIIEIYKFQEELVKNFSEQESTLSKIYKIIMELIMFLNNMLGRNYTLQDLIQDTGTEIIDEIIEKIEEVESDQTDEWLIDEMQKTEKILHLKVRSHGYTNPLAYAKALKKFYKKFNIKLGSIAYTLKSDIIQLKSNNDLIKTYFTEKPPMGSLEDLELVEYMYGFNSNVYKNYEEQLKRIKGLESNHENLKEEIKKLELNKNVRQEILEGLLILSKNIVEKNFKHRSFVIPTPKELELSIFSSIILPLFIRQKKFNDANGKKLLFLFLDKIRDLQEERRALDWSINKAENDMQEDEIIDLKKKLKTYFSSTSPEQVSSLLKWAKSTKINNEYISKHNIKLDEIDNIVAEELERRKKTLLKLHTDQENLECYLDNIKKLLQLSTEFSLMEVTHEKGKVILYFKNKDGAKSVTIGFDSSSSFDFSNYLVQQLRGNEIARLIEIETENYYIFSSGITKPLKKKFDTTDNIYDPIPSYKTRLYDDFQ